MAGMNKTMLTVSNDKDLKLNFTKNGGLIYKGRIFSKVNKYNESYFTSYSIYLFSTEKSMTSFMN